MRAARFQQSKTARQAAVVRTKLKNLLTGATVEKTSAAAGMPAAVPSYAVLHTLTVYQVVTCKTRTKDLANAFSEVLLSRIV